jgi:hypothetical protein
MNFVEELCLMEDVVWDGGGVGGGGGEGREGPGHLPGHNPALKQPRPIRITSV